MIVKRNIKICIDIIMTTALVFLMAFQVTGEVYHEWIGTGILLVFLIHNILNYKWYKSFVKGRYSFVRIVHTVVNLLVLVTIILVGYSGIVMSRHVFAFLPITKGMAMARKIHLSGSYLSFVLMSIHLGIHWTRVINLYGHKGKQWTWILRVLAAALAICGAVVFGRSNSYSYIFLKSQFAMLDYEKSKVIVLLEYVLMMVMWIYAAYYFIKGIQKIEIKAKSSKRTLKGILCIFTALFMVIISIISIPKDKGQVLGSSGEWKKESTVSEPSSSFRLLKGGTFEMGSSEDENWRSEDEKQHRVTLSDFYISAYEVTQDKYESVMGNNPSNFSGDKLPVEMVTWLDAVEYCNKLSEQEGLTAVYNIDGATVSWDRSADGYRLPTEAEWEYACRAETITPFNTETSISAEEANYYGHYPYDIEENYFNQDNLTTKPGEYRETTVAVDSFSPNSWGLYNMHGNVSEWVWDYYGDYGDEDKTDPTGPDSGSLRVYRGGGWNDFAKNMRSAYRGTLEGDKAAFNIGIRLVRNASGNNNTVVKESSQNNGNGIQTSHGKVLIAYFSWGGNTKTISEEIKSQTGADIFEIQLREPYSEDYNEVLDQAQHDQNIQARPEILGHVENIQDYDTILLGYPNWWGSIPMPIASFLEEYDFSGKIIIPFCSNGGGRFGQSQTAIAKLVPDAAMGEGLSIFYLGGDTLSSDIEEWLKENNIIN